MLIFFKIATLLVEYTYRPLISFNLVWVNNIRSFDQASSCIDSGYLLSKDRGFDSQLPYGFSTLKAQVATEIKNGTISNLEVRVKGFDLLSSYVLGCD